MVARDDGRREGLDDYTVADMSGLKGSMPFPHFPTGRAGDLPKNDAGRDVRDELGGDEERRAVVLGTLKAALSIWAVYVIAFGALIALMLALWL